MYASRSARFIISTFGEKRYVYVYYYAHIILPEIFNFMSCVFSEIMISLCLKGYITNNSVSVEGLSVEAVKLSLSVFNEYSLSVS